MDPTYPLVPVVNLLSAFLVVLSLLSRSMRQSWNSGIWMLGFWLFVQGLTVGVDTIVWADNLEDWAPVWCDIVSHIEIGSRVGVPACSLVITRRLYRIIRLRAVGPLGQREKVYELLFDLFLGLGFPFLIMGLYYIVQGVRYAVQEEYGCSSAIVLSGASFLILYAWPILFPLISAVFYSPRIMWMFFRHSRETNRFLHSDSSINRPRYLRLMAMGCIDVLIVLPPGIAAGVQIIFQGVSMDYFPFWPGWSDIHEDWGPVGDPADAWKTRSWEIFNIKINEWSGAFLAIVYFLIFGLTSEAREAYRRLFWAAVRPLGWTPSAPPDSTSMVFEAPSNRSHTRESRLHPISITSSGIYIEEIPGEEASISLEESSDPEDTCRKSTDEKISPALKSSLSKDLNGGGCDSSHTEDTVIASSPQQVHTRDSQMQDTTTNSHAFADRSEKIKWPEAV